MQSEPVYVAPPQPVPALYRSPSLIPGLLALALSGLFFFVFWPSVLNALLEFTGEGWEMILLALVFVSVGIFLVSKTTSVIRASCDSVQFDRDRFAREIGEVLLSGGSPPPYCLYLRPFFTDGELTAIEGPSRYLAFLAVNQLVDLGQKRDVEGAAASALDRHAPLIAFSGTDGRLGAGQISARHDDWLRLFELLVRHARRIIVVPIGQPGTLLEIETIAKTPELLANTVFVRPTNVARPQFAFGPEQLKSLGRMWDWTREQLRERLPAFPPFRGGTRLIVFSSPHKFIECHGNGFSSIQQPSGIRAFLVDGRTAVARFWLSLCVLPAMALTDVHSIRLDVWSEITPEPWLRASPGSSQIVAGSSFLAVVAVIIAAPLALKTLASGDPPWRLARIIGLAYSLSVLAGLFNGSGSILTSLCIARANELLVCLLTFCLLTNREFRRWQIALCVVVGSLTIIIPGIVLDLTSLEDRDIHNLYVLLVIVSLAVVMSAPFVQRSMARRSKYLLIGLAILFSACAALVYGPVGGLFHEYFIPAASPDNLNRDWLAFCRGQLWLRFCQGLVASTILLAFAFAVRDWLGIGRQERWATPLDPYPGQG